MIIVKLMGGLGNQMFQYAVGRRISLLRNTELKGDVSFLNDTSFNHTIRKFELDIFSTNIEIASDEELKKFAEVSKSKFKKGIQLLVPSLYPYHTISEPTHGYIPGILSSPKNSLLVGYWQTEKYFLPIQNIIRNDFTFKKPLTEVNKKTEAIIKSCNSVSMHIRRGDYIHNPDATSLHNVCNDAYYSKALQLIKSKITGIHLFVFSDEIEWVKSNMKFDAPAIYVDNSGEDSYVDMQLMSLCKHNIIANSSFSWWGAWLNDSLQKMVVAPEKWFNNTSIYANDIIPEGWHKI